MERSGFFDAEIVGYNDDGTPKYDREYLAEFFARYFSNFIANGIFPNPGTQCQVVAVDNNMNIRVKPGRAWINGYYYENDDDLIFKLDPADGVLNRVDRIVLRLDFNDRNIKAKLKKGDWSSNAKAKDLQRDADAYELGLVDIVINKGAISITQSNLKDLRLDSTKCGIVHCPVDHIDTTTIFNQFQSWYSQTQKKYDDDINKWTKEKKQAFDTWYEVNTQAWGNEFQTWFDALKEKLDGDVAAKLQKEIDDLKNSKGKPNGLATLDINGKIHSAQLPNIEPVDYGRYQADFGFYNLEYPFGTLNITKDTICINTNSIEQSIQINLYDGGYSSYKDDGFIFVPKVDVTEFNASLSSTFSGYGAPSGFKLIDYETQTILQTYNSVNPGEYIGKFNGILKKGKKYILCADTKNGTNNFRAKFASLTNTKNNDLLEIISGYGTATDKIGVFGVIRAKTVLQTEVCVKRIIGNNSIKKWGNLKFDIETDSSSKITCDILNYNDNLVLSNVSNFTDLSNIDANHNKVLKVRFTLKKGNLTPKIKNFSVTYISDNTHELEKITEITVPTNTSELQLNNISQFKAIKLYYKVSPSCNNSNGYYFTLYNDLNEKIQDIYCADYMKGYSEIFISSEIMYYFGYKYVSGYLKRELTTSNGIDFSRSVIIRDIKAGSNFVVWGCR